MNNNQLRQQNINVLTARAQNKILPELNLGLTSEQTKKFISLYITRGLNGFPEYSNISQTKYDLTGKW